MTGLILVPSVMEHVAPIADNMRKQDRDEVWAAIKTGPHSALLRSYIISDKSWTVMEGDRPIVMFGCRLFNALSNIGSPWLLGTDAVIKHKRQFLIEGRKILRTEIMPRYSGLLNYVDARNTVSINWLRWLGFDIMDPEPYGALRLPFHKFTMGY
jgi:hypothetical protein